MEWFSPRIIEMASDGIRTSLKLDVPLHVKELIVNQVLVPMNGKDPMFSWSQSGLTCQVVVPQVLVPQGAQVSARAVNDFEPFEYIN